MTDPDLAVPPRVGTAGWTIPRQWQPAFTAEGSHLERYAGRFRGVEVNSSFYRQHRAATWRRWADSVPEDFRFSVKMPRAITHDQRLVAADVMCEVFLDEVRGLGCRLGPVLVQLPPSLAFHRAHAEEFFGMLRDQHDGGIVCEPRHDSWFDDEAERVLVEARVARAGADPARCPAAALPGGWPGLAYLRLHGSPRMYYSAYTTEYLEGIAALLRERAAAGAACWCMLDNTTLGAATGDALALAERLG
jgi:uncharacterized protein YecE (DUF72 family)